MELVQTFQDDCVTFGVYGRVNVLHFSHDVRDSHVVAANDLTTKQPSNAYLAIIGETADPPNDAQRRRLMEPFSAGTCPIAAIVFLQTGFRSAVARSAITAMVRIGRISFPMKPCSSISDAARAIEHQIGRVPGLITAAEQIVRLQVQLRQTG